MTPLLPKTTEHKLSMQTPAEQEQAQAVHQQAAHLGFYWVGPIFEADITDLVKNL